MIKTGYEIIGMIKDGKAPKKIKNSENIVYEFESDIKAYYTDGNLYLDLIQCLHKKFEIIEKPKVWKPKDGEEFYYLDLYGATVRGVVESGNKEFVECLYASGNIFKTEEEAQKALEKIKIYNKLKRYAEEHNTGKDNCTNIVLTNNGKLETYTDIDVKGIGIIYFSSEELAEQAIKEIGEDNIKKLFEEE